MKINEEQLHKIFEFLSDEDGDCLGNDMGYIAEDLSGIAVSLNKLVETLKEALEWYKIQVKNQTLRDAVEYKAISLTDAAITIRILLDKWNRQSKGANNNE